MIVKNFDSKLFRIEFMGRRQFNIMYITYVSAPVILLQPTDATKQLSPSSKSAAYLLHSYTSTTF